MAALPLKSSTRAPAGMNCEASSARRSIFFLETGDGGATSDGNSRARLLLTCRFMATGAEVALPDPAHAGESTSSNESLPRFAVNGRRLKFSGPEFRPRLLQNTTEPDRSDVAGKAGRVIGFDGERA